MCLKEANQIRMYRDIEIKPRMLESFLTTVVAFSDDFWRHIRYRPLLVSGKYIVCIT